MEFPILTSHLNDAYTIGGLSDRKQFFETLDTANAAWQQRNVSPDTIRATKEGFNRALRIAWTDLKRSARDPASRSYWQRFACAPEVQTINGFLKTARQPPNDGPVAERVIDLLREVILLQSIVRNLQSLSRHAVRAAAES